jgi:hypothetical protein
MTTTDKQIGLWEKLPTPGLLRYRPSGTYFWRGRVNGRIFSRSLETTVLSEAKRRIPEVVMALRVEAGESAPVAAETPGAKGADAGAAGKRDPGGIPWAAAAAICQGRWEIDLNRSKRTKAALAGGVRSLLARWSDLGTRRLGEIPKDEVQRFFAELADRYSPTHYNSLLQVFKAVCEEQIGHDTSEGIGSHPNPAANIRMRGIPIPDLKLPEPDEFQALLDWLDQHHPAAAVATRVLAYTGARFSEAAVLQWGDIDLDRRTVRIFCAKRRQGSSRSTHRVVPLIPDAHRVLARWRDEHKPVPEALVVGPRRLDAVYSAAAGATGTPRINHHGLRHLFATRCIESGVDIPTVAKWLGHSDGGVLALKVYGHLRDSHSQTQAAKVLSLERPPEPSVQFFSVGVASLFEEVDSIQAQAT